MNTTKSESRLHFKFSLLWVAIAMSLHGYLTYVHFSQLSDSFGKSICDISAVLSCSAVAASKYSEFLGLPISLWGLMTNLMLGVFIIESKQNPESAFPRYSLWLASMVILASVVMGFISLMFMRQYCPFCVALYVVSILTFISVWKEFRQPFWRQIPGDFVALFTDRMGTLTLLFLIPVGAWILDQAILDHFNKAVGGKDITSMIDQRIQDWKSSTVYNINTSGSVLLANGDSKNVIIEFADFMCSHCQAAAPVFESFLESHPEFKFYFLTFPLDGDCNDAIPRKWGVSCRFAKSVYCANQQNKGKEAHAWLFKEAPGTGSPAEADDKNKNIAKALQLDTAKFDACVTSSETHEAVRKMAAEGAKAQIQGTPTVFLNGKVLSGAQSPAILKAALKELE